MKNPFNTILKFFGYTIEKDKKGIVPVSPTAETQGERPEVDYETLWQCYQEHPGVRACVDTFVKAAMSTGWSLTPNVDKPSEENYKKLMNFFDNPNPQESFNEILEDIFKDIMIYGNAYTEVTRGKDGIPLQLWTLNGPSMKVKADRKGTVLGYIQQILGKKVEFKPNEVMHFKLSTKGSTPYGLSFIETLSTVVQADIYAELYNRKFFEQGAKVKKAFRMKNASDAEIKRNRTYLEELAKPENAHKDLLLEGDFDVVDVGVTPRDMEFLELRKFLRDQIFMVFGTPPAMVSIIETAHLGAGTGETQLRLFFKGKVEPLQKKIAAKINHYLIKLGFGIDDWRFYFEVRPDKDVLTQARAHDIYLEHGVLTPNEVRDDLGFSPLEEKMKKESSTSTSKLLPDAEKEMKEALEKREIGLILKFKREFLNLIDDLTDETSKTEKSDLWLDKIIEEERFKSILFPVITQAVNLGQGIARIKLNNKQLKYTPQAFKQVEQSLNVTIRECVEAAKTLVKKEKGEEKLKHYFGARVDILARAEVRKAIEIIVSDICE